MPNKRRTQRSRKNALNENVEVNLPPIRFLYTLDQVASLLNIPIAQLPKIISFGQGHRVNGKIRAVNVVPSELSESPEWRVTHDELSSYLRKCGIVTYERRLK